MKGFKRDGKFIPITDYNKKGTRKSRDQSAKTEGVKFEAVRKKRDEILGKDFHLYKIYEYESSDSDSERQQSGVIKARNIEDVEDYIKKNYFNKEYQDRIDDFGGAGEEQGMIEIAVPYDSKTGKEITLEKAYSLQERKGDDAVNWVSIGYEVNQDDDTEESFHTIYGGNDFVDLLNPERSGKSSQEKIKKAGGIEKAFFSHAGKGFESGNPENEYNLNTRNLKLWRPEDD